MDIIENAGSMDDAHYTDCIEQIKKLKREGKNAEAIDILLRCVQKTETESKKYDSKPLLDDMFAFLREGRSEGGGGVAPWYYEQLAILYRKEKQYAKEVEILERYSSQPKALGVGPKKLAERLIKARELMEKFHI